MLKENKIGFLFLDEIHHLYHFITVAIELAKTNEVSILTYPGQHEFLFSSLERLGGHEVKVEKLPTRAIHTLTDKIKNKKLPRKSFWLAKNKNYIFNNFDAIVFTDYFQSYLVKERGTKAFPKFLYFPHGTPGRSYSYKKDILDFDLALVFGQFHYQQLQKENLISGDAPIVGYPKLDAVQPKQGIPKFNNERLTVIYNPHFSPPHSSWHQLGPDILEFFFQQKEYNLIFAPHVNLFQKKGGQKAMSIQDKFYKAENIFIDLGSVDSVNMTYLNRADIYLGDVSSQVYEFLLQPRPCIFLDTQKVNYKEDINFRFWKCGEVIESIEQLKPALLHTFENSKEKEEIQKEITSMNFYQEPDSTPSERAAVAIEKFLNKARDRKI